MTEAEWLACTEPTPMLEFLRGKASDRKLRLFSVACSRHLLHLTNDNRVGEALDIAERFADGLVGETERSNARKAAQQAAQVRGVVARPVAPKWERRIASLAYYSAARQAIEAAWNVPGLAVEVLIWRAGGHNSCDWQSIKTAEGVIQSRLLRDIFGNPFRPLPPRPEAITPLAKQIYSGAWDKLPHLGKWLQEHGFSDIGEHCLDPHISHVKGCWVVDWVLGKE